MFANRHFLPTAGGEFVLTISQDVVRPNIHQMALADGWGGVAPLRVQFECANVNTLTFGEAWTFPGGVTLWISPNTRIGGQRSGGWAIYVPGIFAEQVAIDNRGIISAAGGSGANGSSASASDTAGHSVTAAGGAGGEGQGYRLNSTIIEGPDPGQPGETACTIGGPWSNPACATGERGGDGYPWGQTLYGGKTTAVYGDRKITWLHVGQVLGERRD